MNGSVVARWLNKQDDISFSTTSELITKYVEILWFANQPLYPHQLKKVKKILCEIESHIDEDVFKDLCDMRDKDLIIKYKLKPKTISARYINTNVDDIKESRKTQLLYKRDNFWRQYSIFFEEESN